MEDTKPAESVIPATEQSSISEASNNASEEVNVQLTAGVEKNIKVKPEDESLVSGSSNETVIDSVGSSLPVLQSNGSDQTEDSTAKSASLKSDSTKHLTNGQDKSLDCLGEGMPQHASSSSESDLSLPPIRVSAAVSPESSRNPAAFMSVQSTESPETIESPKVSGSARSVASQVGEKTPRSTETNRGLIDTAAPFESVREAVSKFGGITDWKAHKLQTAEKRKLVEQELEKIEEEIPDYKKQVEAAEESKVNVLKELESTKRNIEELKLTLEKVQMEEQQATQDSELAKLRVKEIEQGIDVEASVAAKTQLEVAKARHAAAVSELQTVKEELESLRTEYAVLLTEKDLTVASAEHTVAASREVEQTVEELTIELIATKESLESAHTAHLEAEERRIGAALARDQDTHHWEKELKQAEEEIQRLNQQILSAKDMKTKLNSASALLLDLKAELAAYMESKLKEEEAVTDVKKDEGTHTDIQAAVELAKKELEEVKANIEKATEEVNCLKVAAASLQMEIEKETSSLVAINQREGMASVAVYSLEAELDRIRSETALMQSRDREVREKMIEIPRQLQEAAQQADEAKLAAHESREELNRAKEEEEQAKARVSTMQSRLHAVQKEIEAAKASEALALAASNALEESESSQISDDVDSPKCVTLSLEEYYELSKRAHEAEEQANKRVAEAVAQIETVKVAELKSLERLEAVNKEMARRKEELKLATEEAEKAKEGKLGVEQELRKWRAEHGQRRRASEARESFEGVKKPSGFNAARETPNEVSTIPKAYEQVSDNGANTLTQTKSMKKKKKPIFPRILTFLSKKPQK